MKADKTIEQVKKICAALPECEIRGGQHHKLSVRGKMMGWHAVDHHGDVGIYLDAGKVDWKEIEEFMVDAYKLAAPKSLAKLVP